MHRRCNIYPPCTAKILSARILPRDFCRSSTRFAELLLTRLRISRATLIRRLRPPIDGMRRNTIFFPGWPSWLGLSLQNNWPVQKRRELVRQAHRLFDLRGTSEGLKLQIELYAGVKPRILELFRLRRWLVVDSARLGDQSAVIGKDVMKRLQIGENSKIGSFQLIDYGNPSLDFFNSYAYQFIVIVPRWPGATDSDRMALEQIIDMAKPAHTIAQLQWEEPRFRIGLQSFVGIDTVLSKYPVGVIESQGQAGLRHGFGKSG